MPARQPFTALCQTLARPRLVARADLHIHTTHSDGSYTPRQVIDLARRSGLAAVSITDHDCVEGLDTARQAAGIDVEVISGVEITASFRKQVVHLLGYFFEPSEPRLVAALAELREQRVGRFQEMITRLRSCGVALEENDGCGSADGETLGRRHLAALLVKAGRAATVREAFLRYLGDGGKVAVPPVGRPVAEAIALVRGAGGVAAWAHPSYDCARETLLELRDMGLVAIEAEYPGFRRSRVQELRRLAASVGLAVTGGSDCHGPENGRRAIGACTISSDELETLRQETLCRG
jgi:predicted metal-dependent phosphoesterase TrpH